MKTLIWPLPCSLQSMNFRMISMTFVLFLSGFGAALGSEHQIINTLGSSSKGQFVAVEEYAYVPVRKTFRVSVRILNVWTHEFVGEKFTLELPARRPYSMNGVREKVKLMAHDELLKYKIQF